jgi:hypothetical protein
VANAKNTAMNGEKEAASDPGFDLRLRHTGAQELVPGGDAMGAGGCLSDFLLDRADLWSHIDH